MRCAKHHDGRSSAVAPLTYEAEMAAMSRDRLRLFERLRALGHPQADALAVIAAAADCPACAGARVAAKRAGDAGHCFACGRSWSVDRRTAVTVRFPAIGGAA